MSTIKESFINKVNELREERLNEMKKETLGSYINKASYKDNKSIYGAMTTYRHLYPNPKVIPTKTLSKRAKGIETAVNKLTGQAKVPAKE